MAIPRQAAEGVAEALWREVFEKRQAEKVVRSITEGYRTAALLLLDHRLAGARIRIKG